MFLPAYNFLDSQGNQIPNLVRDREALEEVKTWDEQVTYFHRGLKYMWWEQVIKSGGTFLILEGEG